MNEEEARALALNAFAQEVTVLHKPYVDMTGDLIAGLLFSQIMYWCMPNNEGKTRRDVLSFCFSLEFSGLFSGRIDGNNEIDVKNKGIYAVR